MRVSVGYGVATANTLVRKNIFKNRSGDKAYASSVLDGHIAEVERVVPADKLLVYEVKEGWRPLCTFLEVPVLEAPSPRLNDSVAFDRQTGPKFFGHRAKSSAPTLR